MPMVTSYALVITFMLANNKPVPVVKPCIDHSNGYKPVKSREECERIAADQQRRFEVAMATGSTGPFTREVTVKCREISRKAPKMVEKNKKGTKPSTVTASK